MKNIVYTVYDSVNPGVKCHLAHLQRYCNKYDLTLKKIQIKKQLLTKFCKHAAYEHFIASDFDNMLYVDWDVIISDHSENIFDVHSSNLQDSICVYYLPDSLFPDYDYINYYGMFKRLMQISDKFELKRYFNSGVLLASKTNFDPVYRELKKYSKILHDSITQNEHIDHSVLDNVAREEFVFNYVISNYNYKTKPLHKKWNSCYMQDTNTGWRYASDNEELNVSDYFLHFNKSSVEDKIVSMKSTLGKAWKERLYG